jgi:hypothetical protein
LHQLISGTTIQEVITLYNESRKQLAADLEYKQIIIGETKFREIKKFKTPGANVYQFPQQRVAENAR